MRFFAAILAISVTLLACGGVPSSTARPSHQSNASIPPPEEAAEIELVESAPIETTLDHADIRNAADVWPEMIDRARRTIEFAEFYASDAESAALLRTSRLASIIQAITLATKRGVKVRFIADSVFAPKYPATLDALRTAGVNVRIIDCSRRYGGVHHAKYFVVDREESFVGSQNFDYRSLAHIQEIGVRVRSRAIAGALLDVFDTDWALADPSTPNEARVHKSTVLPDVKTRTGESLGLYVDPKGWLPDESRWDLSRVIALVDGAHTSVDLQVLIYSTHNRDKSEFTILDEAIRRAAARGVKVRVLVSHWNTNPGSESRKAIEALANPPTPNINVRVFTIPPWSGGDIPFARVAHAKFMIIDDRIAWIGTSNWEGDYFTKTRNVAIVSEGGAIAPRLDRIFEDDWSSLYASAL